jgi:hypothetical protein
MQDIKRTNFLWLLGLGLLPLALPFINDHSNAIYKQQYRSA